MLINVVGLVVSSEGGPKKVSIGRLSVGEDLIGFFSFFYTQQAFLLLVVAMLLCFSEDFFIKELFSTFGDSGGLVAAAAAATTTTKAESSFLLQLLLCFLRLFSDLGDLGNGLLVSSILSSELVVNISIEILRTLLTG